MSITKHKGKTILPPQYNGNHTAAQAQVEETDPVKAIHRFMVAKRRLLDINHWHEYSKMPITKFALTDEEGRPIERSPQLGDYIRIDLPGPGPRAGEGYDWVRIEQFDERNDKPADTDFFAFRVRPSADPQKRTDEPAHFYTDETTSTFILQRVGARVTACEKGRNEIANANTKNVLDNIRNTLVAVSAANGLAIPQWKALMDGLLKD